MIKRIIKLIENDDLRVRNIILNKASKENQIVYGARAINKQIPSSIQKETSDYDILTKHPKKSAKDLVNELKKHYDNVKLEKAIHKGTYKVKINNKTIVDYTQLKRIPKTKNYLGNKYYKLSSIKQNASKNIKIPSKSFRKEKDQDTLNRIKITEEMFNF